MGMGGAQHHEPHPILVVNIAGPARRVMDPDEVTAIDWLQLAGLVSHTPQQDEEGFWWRTIIQLHAAAQLPAELLQEAVERRAGWPTRERRRRARGRLRNLTAILRRARLGQGAEALQGHCPAS